ncbi:hypothetical protein [Salibacterium qingdaonense]|uniref:Uncharacterized protein n=1 Tax=Salibacterium qingdaonense TaxID=266892 RepID=A0A1I4LWU8_9BACI|nr:hypothetical protein [Salibacterium qingdaonense]SFL95177.1 hypothetical protein SAMN04488054_10927 [Salibacterium qingdaonense]
MLVKVLNLCGVLLLGIGLPSFAIGSFAPEVAEDLFTITWLSILLRIISFIAYIGTVTNVIRKLYKENQVRLVHFQIGVLVSIFGLLIVDWKSGWPIIRSFF